MLAMIIVERAQTELASPVAYFPKRGGTLSSRGDYKNFIAVTICGLYTLPRMDENMDLSGDAQVSSTLDANNGYWQIVVY